jgi:hypothetical protein
MVAGLRAVEWQTNPIAEKRQKNIDKAVEKPKEFPPKPRK